MFIRYGACGVRALLPAIVVFLATGAARADPCVYLDLGDDDDPWTIETETSSAEVRARIVFEVPDGFAGGSWVESWITEGCCDDIEGFGHYGVWCDLESTVFDDAYVDDASWGRALCLCCASAYLTWHFAPDAALVAGERYVIGEMDVFAICETDPDVSCEPTHEVLLGAPTPVCEDPAPLVTFICPAIPVEGTSWARLKGRYR